MELLIAAFHLALIIGFSFYLRNKHRWNSWIFWPALTVKLLAGVCLGLLYRHYFEVGDTFAYFRDGAKLATLAATDLSSYWQLLLLDRGIDTSGIMLTEPRALFFTKITSLMNMLTASNYWAIGFYYSFLSFLAAWSLVRVIRSNVPIAFFPAMVAFLFLPSVVLWTSGVLKESVAMGALFFLTAVFLKVWFKDCVALWEWLLSALSLFVFWKLKYYYAGAFMAIAMSALLHKYLVAPRFRDSAASQAVALFAALILPLAVVTLLHPNLSVDRALAVIVSNNAVYNQLSQPGEYVRFNNLTATPLSVLIHSPWALFSGLFRPLPWEASSVVQIAQAVENALLLALSVAALARVRRLLSSPQWILVLALLLFVVGTCVFITLSAPNFGTLSRYRVGYLSFFALIILCTNPLTRRIERSIAPLFDMSGKP